ncbi:MAG: hypothetical protein HKL90_09900 [Elusimicrobia bacterium]|nr:hypothetical protein [Elusimicrobiota bacterium]
MSAPPCWPRQPRWARFFARDELRRRRYSAFVPAQPAIDLQHGDLECRFTFPVDDGLSPGYLDAPWRRANRETVAAAYLALTTDLREDDVVSGGLAKADEALTLAVDEAGAGRLVAFNPACVPDLTGEDTAGLARRVGARARVLFRPSDGSDMTLKAVAEAARSARAGARREDGRAGAALLGFLGGRAQRELRLWLARLGVETGACLVPCLADACFRAAAEASVLIAADDRLFSEAVRAAETALGRAAVRLPPPYGFAGARAWLLAAADAVGAPSDARAEVAACLEEAERGAEQLVRLAGEHRLAFIVAPGEEALLDDPAENAGVPLVSVLRTFGFGVDVIAGPFGSPEELAAHLARGRFDAVYSDFAFDRRLGRAGKARFSLADFEPGPEGAARTLGRLLGLCRTSFYRRYAGHLR